MRFVGRGHPAIRATHAKTLEFSPDPQITARATCIVAVGTEADPIEPLAGRVRLRIVAGGERFSLEATANPSWDPSGPAVVRRSPLRLPGTFATDATASSADLPRALVAALQDPDALVTVDVVPVPDDRETVVLAYVDPASALPLSVRAERDRADTVVFQDAGARALAGPRPDDDPRNAGGPRTLVIATAALPVNPRPGAAIEVIGLGARLAAAAASPTPGPLVLAGPDDDVRALLRSTPATYRLVLGCEASRLPELLAQALEIRGSGSGVLTQQYAPPMRFTDATAPDLPSRDAVFVCLDAARPDDAIDPAVRSAIDALLADGVSTRTAARALTALTGRDRRNAYDTVVAWRGD